MSAVTAELIARYNRPGPRYTSYPPVPRWKTGGSTADWHELLARVDGPVALYVHIPFCVSQCTYCGCNMVVSKRQSAGDRYLDALEAQLATLRRPQVRWLHLGGGTPTWLDPQQLHRLFAMLDAHAPRLPDHETSVEIDPEVADDARLEALFAGGTNRVSIGVQSLDPTVLEAVGRPQSLSTLRRVVEGSRARGARSVNLDLMVGLPHQSLASLDGTLDGVLSLAPERLAVFGYAHVPWMKRNQRSIDEAALPAPALRAALTARAHQRLVSAGYLALGMDHFALPTDALAEAWSSRRMGRNFMGYTPHRELPVLGVGMSAISEVHGHFLQQEAHLGRWWTAVEAGEVPVHRTYASTCDDLVRADVIRQILCDGEVNLARVEERWGVPAHSLFSQAEPQLQPLRADGLVTVRGHRITVTELGQRFLRLVAMAFDPAMAPRSVTGDSTPRYSQTV